MKYSPEEMQAAVSAARMESATAERQRFTSIMTSAAARGKEKQALTVALAGVDAAQADTILQAAQPDTAPTLTIGPRAGDAPGGLVIDAIASPSTGADAGWSRAVEKANASFNDRVIR